MLTQFDFYVHEEHSDRHIVEMERWYTNKFLVDSIHIFKLTFVDLYAYTSIILYRMNRSDHIYTSRHRLKEIIHENQMFLLTFFTLLIFLVPPSHAHFACFTVAISLTKHRIKAKKRWLLYSIFVCFFEFKRVYWQWFSSCFLLLVI